jgi:hypothetical protein
MVGAGMGFLAGAALGWMGRNDRSADATRAEGTRSEDRPGPPACEQVIYETCARVVWSDMPGAASADLEDAEGIEAFVNGGWELINVIVPFAQTSQLQLSYPGNTRKLIAYFRRPIVRGAR